MISFAHGFLWLVILIASGLLLPTAPADADDRMEWQFHESNDPDNKGRLTARLVYGVPETDNVQVDFACAASSGTAAKFASVTFGADIGDLESGKDVSLRFSGGGFDHAVQGQVHRATEEGVSGVHADIEHGDPLWTAMTEKTSLDYLVPGYKAATLDLERGKDKIQQFVQTCRTYAEPEATIAAPADAGSDSAEKDAFNVAKELGTVEAWDAFLANYPSGFHADMARAYVKKLGESAAPAPSVATASPTLSASTATPTDAACKDRTKLRSQSSNTPAKITFVNKSGMYRSVLWLDFSGHPKDHAGLNPGEQVTIDTFLTHPWMITDGPGNCIALFLPQAGSKIVTLGTAGKATTTATPQADVPAPKAAAPKPAKKKAATGCGKGEIKLEGRCMAKSRAASFCGPGYRVQGNKCVQQNAIQKAPPKPKPPRCPPPQVWSAQEGCHHDD